MTCSTERCGEKWIKTGVGERRKRIFGRPRSRQDCVECISALYCEFISSQEFWIQIRINV